MKIHNAHFVCNSHNHSQNSVELLLKEGCCRIEGITNNIIRVRLNQNSSFREDHSYAIESSLPEHNLNLLEKDNKLLISSGNANLSISKDPLSISIYNNNELLSEGQPVKFTHDTITDSRIARTGEDFYGLGERMTPLGRRGYSIVNWNTDNSKHHHELDNSTYSSFPFFISVNKSTGQCFGYFLDSPYRSSFTMGTRDWDEVQIEIFRDELNVYFFTANSIAEILKDYTMLSGRHALPPLWSLGYHQCRWSYMSANEICEIADTFRRKKIPCDTLWLDIDYMDSFRIFTFDNKYISSKPGFSEHLEQNGFRKIVIVDPGIKSDEEGMYDVCDEGKMKGYFIKGTDGKIYTGKVWPGGTFFPDFSRKDVRSWWGNLHQRYYDAQIDGFWNDMNEPADHSDSSGTIPENVRMCDNGRWSTMDKMHNVYANLMAKATYDDAMMKFFPEKRPFMLTRAAYAGMQKYSAKWGGDNFSSWAHLKGSISQLINMGLSGLGFFGADVGGFFGNTQPELLARWTQLGAFYPFFRNHCCKGQTYQEPWRFGEQIEEICRKAVQLRYHLIPYFYQLFHQMHVTGAPVIRPLFWHYQHDPLTYTITDQFMLGQNMIAAPVLERDAKIRAVYLPEGNWYHYFSGQIYEGGKFHLVNVDLDSIPLFVRQGCVIPVMPVVDSTSYIDRTLLSLEIFHGSDGFDEDLYEDDMLTNAYRDGNYLFNKISLNANLAYVELDNNSAFTRVVFWEQGPDGKWFDSEYKRGKQFTHKLQHNLKEGAAAVLAQACY